MKGAHGTPQTSLYPQLKPIKVIPRGLKRGVYLIEFFYLHFKENIVIVGNKVLDLKGVNK